MAEIKITVNAQDNTQDVFRAIGEGAKSAFNAIEAAAWDSGSLVASSFDTLRSKFAAVTDVQRTGVETLSAATQQDADTTAASMESVFNSIGSVRQAISALDGETARQRVIEIDTTKAVSDVSKLSDLIRSLPSSSGNASPAPGSDYQPGSYTPPDNGGDAGYATGTDYVPRTGFYKLHQGEAVIPAAQNRSSGSSSSSAGYSGPQGVSISIASGAIVIQGANKSPEELARLIAQPMQKELQKLSFIAGTRS